MWKRNQCLASIWLQEEEGKTRGGTLAACYQASIISIYQSDLPLPHSEASSPGQQILWDNCIGLVWLIRHGSFHCWKGVFYMTSPSLNLQRLEYSSTSQICHARQDFSSCSQEELMNVFLSTNWEVESYKKNQLTFFLLRKEKISVKQFICLNANLSGKQERNVLVFSQNVRYAWFQKKPNSFRFQSATRIQHFSSAKS